MNWGITNAKGKSGGDAELNIAYGSTPPSDTSKIWVKCDTPSKVKVEANRSLVISSNENAKVKTDETIATTYVINATNTKPNQRLVKDGNVYYISSYGSTNSRFKNTSIYQQYVYKMDENGNITTLNTSQLTYSNYALFNYDTNRLLWVRYDTSNSRIYFTLVNKQTGQVNSEYVYSSNFDSAYIESMCLVEDTIYGISAANSSQRTKLFIKSYKLGGVITSYEIPIPSGLYRFSDYCATPPIHYNGALYVIINVSTSSSPSRTNSTPKLYKWVIGSNELIECCTLPTITSGTTQYPIGQYTPLKYANKMIITNINDANSSSQTNGGFTNYIYIIDLDTYQWEKLVVREDNFAYAYVCVDENTGDIELWGGYPTSTNALIKTTISNIYELEENTLELFYDTTSSNNIRLLNTATLTMDAPINHAWLGDSNNIAQSVNMFYYKNNLWYGVNCLGYTQLENCVILANDVSVIPNASTQQEIGVFPTWAYETGQTTLTCASADETIATCSISNGNLITSGVAVGTTTITLTITDEYGTKFTRTINVSVSEPTPVE